MFSPGASIEMEVPKAPFWKISIVPVNPEEEGTMLYFEDQLDAAVLILSTDLLSKYFPSCNQLMLQEVDMAYSASRDFLVLDLERELTPRLVGYLDSQHMQIQSRLETILKMQPDYPVRVERVYLSDEEKERLFASLNLSPPDRYGS